MTPIPILLYHSIGDAPADSCQSWYVGTATFEAQMNLIAELGYTCLTVSALVDALDLDRLPSKPLAITFDDGAEDFQINAAPILRRYQLPATMYVPTAFIGESMPWSHDERDGERRIMGWDALRSFDSQLVEIGVHSATHPQLDLLASAQRRAEIVDSKAAMEAGLGRAIRSFAYPHGYHSSAVRQMVRDAGYDSASACGNRWSFVGEDRFALSRLFVFGAMTVDDLRTKLQSPPRHAGKRRSAARFGWRCVRRVRRARQRLTGARR